MFTQEELRRGAKRAVLEYLAENEIPIATIVPASAARQYVELYKQELIVRADTASQWNGFSGIYGSYLFPENSFSTKVGMVFFREDLDISKWVALATPDEQLELPEELELQKAFHERITDIKETIVWYCNGLGIPIPDDPLEALIQVAHSTSDTLFQHPSDPNLVILNWEEQTLVYDRKKTHFHIFCR